MDWYEEYEREQEIEAQETGKMIGAAIPFAFIVFLVMAAGYLLRSLFS